MSEELNNPAARLVEILRRIQRGHSNKTVRQAVADALGISPDVDSVLHERLVLVDGIAQEARTKLEADGVGADFMLRDLAVVEKQIIPALHNLNSNASGVGKKITPEILRGLDGCAYALSMSDAEPALDRNKLADIRRELDELADKLAHADDLDPDLRAFLADAISALIRANRRCRPLRTRAAAEGA